MTMRLISTILAASIAAMAAMPAAAQDADARTTADEVRAEITEAMDAVAAYSGQERDEALAEAREAFARLDAEIERRDQALRESWTTMSDAARDTAGARLRDLRRARNRLAERYGALESGADSAWDELAAGFSDAWTAFVEAWTAADEDAAAN
jgi:hypothetical protein